MVTGAREQHSEPQSSSASQSARNVGAKGAPEVATGWWARLAGVSNRMGMRVHVDLRWCGVGEAVRATGYTDPFAPTSNDGTLRSQRHSQVGIDMGWTCDLAKASKDGVAGER